MNSNSRFPDLLKKGVKISGALARGLIGIGAGALALLALLRKRPKRKSH